MERPRPAHHHSLQRRRPEETGGIFGLAAHARRRNGGGSPPAYQPAACVTFPTISARSCILNGLVIDSHPVSFRNRCVSSLIVSPVTNTILEARPPLRAVICR